MASPPAGTAYLKVLAPGLCTLVVDHGRPRARSLGVPVGGAADRASLDLGNALVGNPPDAAALEVTLAGPTLEAGGELACVVFGAPFELAGDRRPLAPGKTFTLSPGERLHIRGTPERARAYLCVRGGFQTAAALGSRSGLRPLAAGDDLPCTPGRIPARFFRHPSPLDAEPDVLRVTDGRQAGWFPAGQFYGQAFTVRTSSDRMGLRLRGGPLPWPGRELVSEPVCPGAAQVTPDGQCIVLGVDGQTIGGYPKAAQVIRADLDKLGQLRPGDGVRFRRVGLEEAEALARERRDGLRAWLTWLREAPG
jgi:antagonist of KipI